MVVFVVGFIEFFLYNIFLEFWIKMYLCFFFEGDSYF